MAYHTQTAKATLNALETGAISCEALVADTLSRIDAVENKIKGFAHYDPDHARKKAQEIDTKRHAGKSLGHLAGLPIAIKDNICNKNRPTTCASNILFSQNGTPYCPPYHATVVEKLEAEDAIIIGSANMDEFAMGSSTENSALHTTVNPWDTTRVPGGSSGGSAALVAADEVFLAFGSDTGGSIRQPAGFCGTVGLKPLYGTVSRYGLIAFASSLDQIGPLAKTVQDAALAMDVIAGFDTRDATSINSPHYGHYQGFLKNDIAGMRIGLPKECFAEGLDNEVGTAILAAKNLLTSWGATVEEVSLPHSPYAVATYYIVANAEASTNLARFDGVQYGLRSSNHTDIIDMYFKTRAQGFGDEVKRRILLGTYVLSSGYYDAYYKKAQKVRTLIKADYEALFKDAGIDCLLMPTSPSPAFKMGERINDPLQMYLSDIFTISTNLAGNPAIAIPCGFSQQGLPISMQFIGDTIPGKGTGRILRAAYTFEQRTDYHVQKPTIHPEQ